MFSLDLGKEWTCLFIFYYEFYIRTPIVLIFDKFEMNRNTSALASQTQFKTSRTSLLKPNLKRLVERPRNTSTLALKYHLKQLVQRLRNTSSLALQVQYWAVNVENKHHSSPYYIKKRNLSVLLSQKQVYKKEKMKNAWEKRSTRWTLDIISNKGSTKHHVKEGQVTTKYELHQYKKWK